MVLTAADFLYNALKDNASVAAFVGARIVQHGAEINTYPFITYQKSGGKSEYSHTGASKLGHPRYAVMVHSYDPSERDNLGEAVKTALEAFKGTAGGVECMNCQYLTDMDGFDPSKKIYFRHLTFEIWHREA